MLSLIVSLVLFFLLLGRINSARKENEKLAKRLEELERALAARVKVEPTVEEPAEEVVSEEPLPESSPPPALATAELARAEPAAEVPATPPVVYEEHEPVEAAAAAGPAKRSSLVSFLVDIKVLPPADEGLKEAGLIQWWAPRVGGALALLATIFLAIYVSKNTNPLIRFLELLAADVAVIGLGFYLLRSRERIGNVLLSTGLTMLYVTAMASYAASPVRVFQNPLHGIAFQMLVVAAIYWVSYWRRNTGIAILATGFGYVSCIFAAYTGFNEAALITALLLQALGLGFGSAWRSKVLVSLSVLGSYLPVGAFCIFGLLGFQSFTLPYSANVLAFLLITSSALPLVELRGLVSRSFSSEGFRTLSLANIACCAGLGYVFFKLTGGTLTLLYLSLGVTFLLWAAIYYAKTRSFVSFNYQLYLLKGSAFATLFLANALSDNVRGFAIAVQAALMAWNATLSKSKWQGAMTLGLAAVSGWLSFYDLVESNVQLVTGEPIWYLFTATPVVLVFAISLQAKLYETKPFKVAHGLASIGVGLVGLFIAIASAEGRDSLTLLALLTAALLAAVGLLPRVARVNAGVAAAIPFFFSHLSFWTSSAPLVTGLALLLVSLAFAFACQGRASRLPQFLVLSATGISCYAYFFSSFSSAVFFPALVPLACIAILRFRVSIFRTLQDIVPVLILVDIGFTTEAYGRSDVRASIATLAYLALLALPLVYPKAWGAACLLRRWRVGRRATVLLGSAAILFANSNFDQWLFENVALVVCAAAVFAIAHRTRGLISYCAFLCFAGVVGFRLLDVFVGFSEASPWSWQFILVGGMLAAVLLAAAYVSTVLPLRQLSAQVGTFMAYAQCALGVLACFIVLAYPALSLQSYYTPAISVACIGLVVLGIGLRVKPYRLVGLCALLVPLVRLFVYDMKSALHRIIAFAVLAVLLTGIGYLYSKFSHRITGEDRPGG